MPSVTSNPAVAVSAPSTQKTGVAAATLPTQFQSIRLDMKAAREQTTSDFAVASRMGSEQDKKEWAADNLHRSEEIVLRLQRLNNAISKWAEHTDGKIFDFSRPLRSIVASPAQKELASQLEKIQANTNSAQAALKVGKAEGAAVLDLTIARETGRSLSQWERLTQDYRTISREESLGSLSNTLGNAAMVTDTIAMTPIGAPLALVGIPLTIGKLLVDRIRGAEIDPLDVAALSAGGVIGMAARAGKESRSVGRLTAAAAREFPDPDGPLSPQMENALRKAMARLFAGRTLGKNTAAWIEDMSAEALAGFRNMYPEGKILDGAKDAARNVFRSADIEHASELRKYEGHITFALAERTRVVNERIHGFLGKTANIGDLRVVERALRTAGASVRETQELIFEAKFLRVFNEELKQLVAAGPKLF